MLDICHSMSKYPLGSNLGGTGDWGGDWGFRVSKVFHMLNTCHSMSKYCASHTILRVSLKVANHESPSVL